MRTRVATLILTAVTVLAVAAALIAPRSEAQVGTSTLQGIACSPANVQYIRAPGPGEGVCDRGIPGAAFRLTMAGALGTSVPAKTATGDEKGAYSFAQLSDGDYTLEATHAGFDPVKMSVKVSGATIRDVAMNPQDITVAGKAQGAAGEPVADAAVYACCTGANIRTGADGSFALKTRAGYQYISINDAAGYRDFSSERFLDGSAQVFRLERVPAQTASVSGTILDQDGKPLANVRIDASSYGNAQPMPYCDSCASDAKMMPYYGGNNHTRSDAAGRYFLHLDPGQANLFVNLDGYAPFRANFQVDKDQAVQQDIKMLKYPAKTAHIVGQLPAGVVVSISVRSPQFGLYECSDGGNQPVPMMAASEPGTMTYSGGESSTYSSESSTAPGYAGGGASMVMPYPYYNGCAIHVRADGSFEGNVTPGYSLIEVYPQGDCQNGDCQPHYYQWTATVVLGADRTTRLDVHLRPKPGPDAKVQGYVIDAATGKAIPNAQVSFSSLDSYGYGQAATDSDGSYAIKLRSGLHQVNIYVQGYFSWEATIDVATGANDLDIKLTAGTDANGGCCIAYAAGGAMMKGDAVAASDGGAPAPASYTMTASGTAGPQGAASYATSYEDLHGGLGPYDASKRADVGTGADGAKASPAAAIAMLGAALVLAALVRRKVA